MIEKLKSKLSESKYLTLTLTDLGDVVQITATLRPKDGSDAAQPLQIKADYTVADSLLLAALADPTAGKKKHLPADSTTQNEEPDLFGGMEE